MTFLRGDVSQAGDSKESLLFYGNSSDLATEPYGPLDVLDTLLGLCQANAMALGRV